MYSIDWGNYFKLHPEALKHDFINNWIEKDNTMSQERKDTLGHIRAIIEEILSTLSYSQEEGNLENLNDDELRDLQNNCAEFEKFLTKILKDNQ